MFLRLIIISCITLAPLVARAESEPLDKGEILYSCGATKGKVIVRFKPDVTLGELVTWAMGFTCKNFVYNSGVSARSAKATLVVPERLSVEQAWRVFLVGLESMGLTVVPRGEVLVVVESGQAKSGALPLYAKTSPSGRAQVVRKLFRPAHIETGQLATALDLLKSKHGEVTALPELGMVLVTDFADQIARMSTLVGEVDRPRPSEALYAIKIHRVDAVELARVIEQLLERPPTPATPARRSGKARKATPPRTPAQAPKLVADGRTNTLLMVASETSYKRVRALVDRLDIAVDGEASGSIHLYSLENADAETLAQTLQQLISGAAPAAVRGKAKSPAAAPTIEGQVRVAFDKPTNALLFVATTRDYLALSQIVRQLDAPRRQVYIEAMVFEVTTKVERQLGISAHGGSAKDGDLFVGGFQAGSVSSASPESLLSVSGLVGGIFGKPLSGVSELLGTSVPSFGLAVHALATNNTLDVLSEPHILTADHKEAVLSVGKNIPYKAQLVPVPGAGDAASLLAGTSVERQKVALTLKITPHISSSSLIRLDLDLAKDDVLSEDYGSGLGVAWSTSSLTNSVVVHDQETIVVGGLVSDTLDEQRTKVPVLGDLPLLGHLFRSTKKTKRKTNLLVLVTPHIVHDQRDARRIFDRRMRERHEFLRAKGSFERVEYTRSVDYRRKRGLVEEINREVARIEQERRLRRELERELVAPPDQVELSAN